MADMDAPSRKTRVLFLCVHNSGRSQMAEALLRHLAGETFEVESAGFEPRPVLVEAVNAMKLLGIDISRAQSKAVFDLYRAGRIFDYVIAVCDEATAEQCPIFPGVCERVHWAFPDPSALKSAGKDRLREVIEIRDAIRLQIEQWLEETRKSGLSPRFGSSRPVQRQR